MHKFLYLFLFFFLTNILKSQENNIPEKEFPVFKICSLVPVKNQKTCFNETLNEYIEENLVFPESAKELGLQSVVNVYFEIDVEGRVSNLIAKSSLVGVKFTDKEALDTANKIFEDAASDLFYKLPVMKPGKINGVTSSFPLRVPLTYQLNTQNFDYNELFSIDEVDWAPLFPKTNNITSEQSIEIFKDNINSYIKRYLKHPKNSNNANDQVIVFVEMIVENDGSVSEITSFGPDLYRKQAEKVVKRFPSLEPALKNDYPVAMTYSFPVIFNKK